MKKDALKKHHFWYLLGAVPLLIGILFLLLITVPEEAIAEAQTKYNAGLKATQDAKPPGKGALDDLDKQKAELEKLRDLRWKDNYERQQKAGVYKWPNAARSPVLEAFEKLDLRFGTKKVEAIDANAPADRQFVERNDEIEKFTKANNYYESYKALAEGIAPTMYEKGTWTSVLRYVTDWKNGRPPYEQFWLALEDYWVQKALLHPIQEVNAEIAKFDDVTAKVVPDTPLKRLFRSRVWDLNIELVTDNGVKVLKSKLKNRTDRLQLLGAGKSMRLNVWLDDPKRSPVPFEYRIEGEVVKGNEEITPRFVPALHRIPAGQTPDKIWKVEQIFDATTVPVRLVRRVDLGYTDNKRAASALKPPKFMEEEIAPVDPALAGATPAVDTGAVPPPGGTPAAAAGATPLGPKIGTHDEVLLGNKKRYLEVTEQIRRMPVGIVIVVDQAYVNDLLVAYSNSPLRFHTTQVQMQRFRERLPTVQTATAAPPTGTVAPPVRPGVDPVPSAGGPVTSAENSSTAGLTEVAIYGIVTFYEKYAAKAAAPKK